MSDLIVVSLFAFIGAGLKVIDQVFDEGMFTRQWAIVTAVMVVPAWVYLSLSPYGGTILFAVLFASLFAGKVDNMVFIPAAAVLTAAGVLMELPIRGAPFLVLATLGFLDEKGNDRADAWGGERLQVLIHRPFMKIGVVGMALLTVIPWAYAIAFLAFDGAYDLAGFASAQAGAGYTTVKRVLASIR